MALSAACCLSADGLRLTLLRSEPRSPCCRCRAAPSVIQHFDCSPGGGANPPLPKWWIKQDTHSPPLSLETLSFFCQLCCFWLRLSNRLPVGMTMAGGKEEASTLADLGFHKNKPVTYHPSCWRGGELPCGLLLSRGGCDERAAVGKQYIQWCYSSEINKPFFTFEFYSD